MKKLLIINIFFYTFSFTFSQVTYEHTSNTNIYSFLDELAAEKIITLNSAIKPYSKLFIYEKLEKAYEKIDKLNRRQQEELIFYQKVYGRLSDSLDQPVKSNFFLDIFRDSKHSTLDINPPGYFYKDSLVALDIQPIWGIRYREHEKDAMRHYWGGAKAYLNIGKHWGMYASLRDNSMTRILAYPSNLTRIEGGNYKWRKKGGDYSEMRGGITYSWKWGDVGLIKDHLVWGDNYHGANILSGRAPSFAMLKFHINPVKWLDFNYFHGWLVSEVLDSNRTYITSNGDLRTVYRDKYMAANMYTIIPWRGVHFSFGNSIIYSDMNVQPAYLIPFMFFKSVDHTINHSIDNQNSQMFFNLSIRKISHLHVYSSLFVDEFSIKRVNDPDEHNFSSWKGGMRLSNWPVNNIILTFEYTETSPITFKHRIPSITYATNQFNLGHYLRDNSKEFYYALTFKPFRGFSFNIDYMYAVHGNEYEYVFTQNNPPIDSHATLEDKTWDSEVVGITAKYEMVHNTYLFAEYMYSNIKGYDCDGETGEYYLEQFTPPFYRGVRHTLTLGFNIGF